MYYLKVEVKERYSSWTEFREIEFFQKDGTKIPTSQLKIIDSNFVNSTYPISRAIDNDIPAGRGNYVADQGPVPHFVIIESAIEFWSIKWWDDGYGGYSSKKIEFYSSPVLLNRNDSNWTLREVKQLSNTNFQSFSIPGFTFGTKTIYFKNEGKVYSATTKTMIELPDEKDETVSYYGVKQNVTVNLQEPFDKKIKVMNITSDVVSTFPVGSNIKTIKLEEVVK